MAEKISLNKEEERRFLVRGDEWNKLGKEEYLNQGYLNTSKERTVRVRIKGSKGYFTVKGPTVKNEKVEIETEIPIEKVKAVLDSPGLCIGFPIEKTRRTIKIGDLTWEVDEFKGVNSGLIIAEVEKQDSGLDKESWNKKVDSEKPPWIGNEVSGEKKYFNSMLTEKPFSKWTEEEKQYVRNHIASK